SAEVPLLSLTEVTPAPHLPMAGATAWTFFRDLLGADADSAAYTLEEGMWREVWTHQTPLEDVAFQDYAGDRGWTVRFGAAGFGRGPDDAQILQARFTTAPGSRA